MRGDKRHICFILNSAAVAIKGSRCYFICQNPLALSWAGFIFRWDGANLILCACRFLFLLGIREM
jgi:hypothetical protein